MTVDKIVSLPISITKPLKQPSCQTQKRKRLHRKIKGFPGIHVWTTSRRATKEKANSTAFPDSSLLFLAEQFIGKKKAISIAYLLGRNTRTAPYV